MPWSPLNKKYLIPILEQIKNKDTITIEELRQIFTSETLIVSINSFKRFIEGLILLGIVSKTYDPLILKVNKETCEKMLNKLIRGE